MKNSEQQSSRTLAVVLNSRTPYWIHTYQRLGLELPMPVHVLITSDGKKNPWHVELPEDIHPQYLTPKMKSPGEPYVSLWAQFDHARRLAKRIRELGATDIIIHGYHKPSIFFLLLMIRGHVSNIMIRADSNIRSQRSSGLVKKWFKRQYLRLIDLWVDRFLPFGSMGKAYFESYGIMPEKVSIAPVEPDYSFFEDRDLETEKRLIEELNFSPDRMRIVFVGRFIQEKAPDLLVSAFLEIADKRSEWDLVMLGEGPQLEQTQALVPERMKSRVIWLGFRQILEVRSILHLSEILVLPSRYEPWALVINEGLAAGLCCMASRVVASAVDLVGENDFTDGSLIFETNSQQALRDAMFRVTDPEALWKYHQYCHSCYYEYRTKYDSLYCMAEILDIIIHDAAGN